MKMRVALMAGVVLLSGLGKATESGSAQFQAGDRVVQAVRLSQAVHLDGDLREKAWKTRGYSSFVQSSPRDGDSPSEKTRVWVAYDDKAIYIAARLFDSDPEAITRVVGRRDDWVSSDWFIVGLDTYFDHSSGLEFAVNPAGCIVDWTLFNDVHRDSTWDGIWTSAARVDEKGWSVEIRIPYSQLRFPPRESYIWGVNFRRVINRRNETSCFAWVPQREHAYVSRFARLEGLEGIKPPRKIEVSPYTLGGAAFQPAEEGNPYQTGRRTSVNAGADLRMRLRSDLMLNVTVNPDFGQVEVDPAVLNLGTNEIYLQERRPFFVEGRDLFRFGYGGANNNWSFNWGNPSFFYSRRIGAAPRGSLDTNGYENRPEGTAILAAAKLTGKVMGKWNFGALGALTREETARICLDGVESFREIEPFAAWGVARAQREFNGGRQGLGFIVSSVIRNPREEAMLTQFSRSSVGAGIDGWTFLDKDRMWVVTGWLGGTSISGDPDMMAERRRSWLHYFQRPDADYLDPDAGGNRLSGWAGRVAINKQKGNWFVNAALGAISPGFDSTETGFQWRTDVINGHIAVGYRSYSPGPLFNRWNLYAATWRSYNFGGNQVANGYFLTGYVQFHNHWDLNTRFFYIPECMNDRRTRGGPLTMESRGYSFSMGVGTNSSRRIVLGMNGDVSADAQGAINWSLANSVSWKIRPNLVVQTGLRYRRRFNPLQWVGVFEDSLMTSTYGNRYLFAGMDQKTLSMEFRVNWAFSPRMSLQLYMQPYMTSGIYSDFRQLARPGTMDFPRITESGVVSSGADGTYLVDPDSEGPAASFAFDNPDFNFKSLRGTMVFRWEYRPGSAIFLVWTQRRSDSANPGDFRLWRDFSDMLTAKGDNIFMVKFVHRFEI